MRRALLLLATCCGVAPIAAVAQGVAVEGLDRSRLEPPSGVAVADYVDAGYRLHVRPDGDAEVEVDASPLRSAAPFVLPQPGRSGEPPAIERLARDLVTGAATRYDAVSRLLGWVSRSVSYELDRSQPQDAVAVLERRRGYCTGIARLSVALLQAVGIEAREVAGWVVDPGRGTTSGYHRWIEVYYQDRGWAFSDPLASHNFVPANYLRLASDQVDAAAITGGLLLQRDDRLAPVDVYGEVAPGVRVRRNSARQRLGSLRVVAPVGRPGTAVLEGGGMRRSAELRAGENTFLGLEAGTYMLRVSFTDGGELARRVRLRARVRSALFLPDGAATGEGGTR